MPNGFRILPSNSFDRASPNSRWLFLELQPAHFRFVSGIEDVVKPFVTQNPDLLDFGSPQLEAELAQQLSCESLKEQVKGVLKKLLAGQRRAIQLQIGVDHEQENTFLGVDRFMFIVEAIAEAQMVNFQELSSKQQSIVAVSAFAANGNLDKLKTALNGGLAAGLTVNEIKEILVQLYAYTGFPRSQAVLIAIGINWEGRRCVLGVELANRESSSSWKELLLGLRRRGFNGVEFVVSDDHAGLRKAIAEVLNEAVWQRGYVHFLRKALDYLPRKADDDCLMELRWIYDRRNLEEAQRDIGVWLAKWSSRYPKLCSWVEENIPETLSFYRLPRQHHKHLKSSNMLERLMEEFKRRTLIVRIFPNPASCSRLIRALAIEMHENWIEATRYLNMETLFEQKKEALRKVA
jgi:alkylhydroperoxidase/carboxymuconolactone decarboxylase family protein YurZ